MKRMFLCVYVDAFEEERLLLVADEDCTREVVQESVHGYVWDGI